MAETTVTITNRRRHSHGKFYGETGQFEKPETNDIVVETKLRSIVWFKIAALNDQDDQATTIHWNSATTSATEDDPGKVWIETGDLGDDAFFIYEAIGRI
jgi:hypothetical protein